jgi:hypothetical protein
MPLEAVGMKEELLAKLNAIRNVSIPESVAGKSTEKVRRSIDAFCAALQTYIDSMGLDGSAQGADDL